MKFSFDDRPRIIGIEKYDQRKLSKEERDRVHLIYHTLAALFGAYEDKVEVIQMYFNQYGATKLELVINVVAVSTETNTKFEVCRAFKTASESENAAHIMREALKKTLRDEADKYEALACVLRGESELIGLYC